MRTLLVVVLVTAVNQVSAQIPNACQVTRDPGPLAWQDTFINPKVCNQERISETWNHFHMSEGGWDGYGLQEDACTADTALSRTFNGLLLLRNAGANPTCDPNEFPLDWAYCFSSEVIVKLVAGCYDPSASARTFLWGLDQMDERTELYMAFYYTYGPPMRAATMYHEARHADDDCIHTSNCTAAIDRSGNRTLMACDPQWEHGCVGGNGKGSYAWTAIWLHRYAVESVPDLINQDLREYAVQNANVNLGRNFDVTPCFTYEATTGHVQQILGCTQ